MLIKWKFTYYPGSGVLFQAKLRGFTYLGFLERRLQPGGGSMDLWKQDLVAAQTAATDSLVAG